MSRSKRRFAASRDELRFARRAAQDLNAIADHIRERNPQATPRARAAIVESLRTLVRFPHIGRQQKAEGVRKLVTRRYPYLVYYVIDDAFDEIVILAIQHPAREREHSDT